MSMGYIFKTTNLFLMLFLAHRKRIFVSCTRKKTFIVVIITHIVRVGGGRDKGARKLLALLNFARKFYQSVFFLNLFNCKLIFQRVHNLWSVTLQRYL